MLPKLLSSQEEAEWTDEENAIVAFLLPEERQAEDALKVTPIDVSHQHRKAAMMPALQSIEPALGKNVLRLTFLMDMLGERLFVFERYRREASFFIRCLMRAVLSIEEQHRNPTKGCENSDPAFNLTSSTASYVHAIAAIGRTSPKAALVAVECFAALQTYLTIEHRLTASKELKITAKEYENASSSLFASVVWPATFYLLEKSSLFECVSDRRNVVKFIQVLSAYLLMSHEFMSLTNEEWCKKNKQQKPYEMLMRKNVMCYPLAWFGERKRDELDAFLRGDRTAEAAQKFLLKLKNAGVFLATELRLKELETDLLVRFEDWSHVYKGGRKSVEVLNDLCKMLRSYL